MVTDRNVVSLAQNCSSLDLIGFKQMTNVALVAIAEHLPGMKELVFRRLIDDNGVDALIANDCWRITNRSIYATPPSLVQRITNDALNRVV
jgi:hypothetical protein